MNKVKFTEMKHGTKEDYLLLDKHEKKYVEETADRILKFMSGLTKTLEVKTDIIASNIAIPVNIPKYIVGIKLDKIKIKETLPVIKNCNIAVCNDSSFSHLSAALNIPTIVLLSDTPLMYGNYSPNMYSVIPDGEETVTHNTLGKEKINPEKIFKIFKEILN